MSEAKPENSLRVIAAVIERDGRFLLCQRPEHKRHGMLWEFPGGKLEEGETLFQAAQRELLEELALEVIDVGAVLYADSDAGSPFIIEFVKVDALGDAKLLEHHELRWVDKNELLSLALAPTDLRFANFFCTKK